MSPQLNIDRAFDELERRIPALAARFAPYYAASKWQWTVANGQSCPGYVPTTSDIEHTLRDLLRSQREGTGEGCTSSGGLQVWRDGDEVGISFEDDEAVDAIDAAYDAPEEIDV